MGRAILFAILFLSAATPAMAADSSPGLTCAQLMVIGTTPNVGDRIIKSAVEGGIKVLNDRHELGENVVVNPAALSTDDKVGWVKAYCTAHPDAQYGDAERALYGHMAELQGIQPPPVAQGLFPPSSNETIHAAIKEASTEPLDDLEKNIEHLHPAAMIILAKRLEENGRHDDALFWFSEGQIRWLAHVMQTRDSVEQGAFERISSGVGVEINKFPARDAERVRASIDKALAWDRSHPDAFTPPGPAKDSARKILDDLRAHVVAEPNELARENAEAQQEAAASPDDPYSGSGGAMFGTPQEMVPPYDAANYSGFKVGVTTKADVVKALGKPEMWFTDKDGNTTLNYPVAMTHNAMAAMGLVRRTSVSFTFDAKRVLKSINLPKDDTP